MNTEETKELLAAYRDDLALEDAPGMAEALHSLEADPELAAWFEQDRACDQHMKEALGSIPVPDGLKESILAQIAETENNESDDLSAEEQPSNIVAFPRRRAMWLTAAALFVIAASLVKYFAFPPPVQFPGNSFAAVATFRDHMAFFANSRFVLDHGTNDLENAKAWLAEHQSPTYAQTPSAIVNYQGMGCKSFDWGEHKVSLICFKNSDDDIVHLFVMNKAALKDLQPASPLNEVLVQRELETGGWVDDEYVYMLVGSEAGVKIGDILKDAVS